jgi:hypothetical protein
MKSTGILPEKYSELKVIFFLDFLKKPVKTSSELKILNISL